jgi:hypothetical protein
MIGGLYKLEFVRVDGVRLMMEMQLLWWAALGIM